MDLTVDNRVARYAYRNIGKVAQRCGIELATDPDEERFTVPISYLPKDDDLQPLCDKCQGMSMSSLRGDAGYQHSADLGDLIRSARFCPLCRQIERQICSAISFHARRKVRYTNAQQAMDAFAHIMADQELFVAKPTSVALKLEEGDPTQGFSTIVIGTTLYSRIPGVKAFASYLGRFLLHDDAIDNPQPVRGRGSDQDIMERLAAWLRRREQRVPLNEFSWNDSPLPTRVLDLGEPRVKDLAFLESDLHILQTAGQKAKYVTLSYCWGGYRDTITVKDNYDERRSGIRFKELPVVFAQAIKITRALGVRYLWIDALCIIQDDPEDWSREAARMSEVYWNSVCRLAVTDSKDPTESFFPPTEYPSVRVPHLQAPKMVSGIEGLLGEAHKLETEEQRLSIREKMREFLSLGRQGNMGIRLESNERLGGRTALASPGQRKLDDQGNDSVSTRKIAPGIIRRDGNSLRKLDVSSSSSGHNDRSGDWHTSDTSSSVPRHLATPMFGTNSESGHTKDKDSMTAEILEDMMRINWDTFEETIESTTQDNPKPEDATNVYLTIPRSYAVDVDRGHLNSRGWVLQERLLAPRTIHFTHDHIYCEDNDDICGEDWVGRYFTWMSCIYKTTKRSQIDLFPERAPSITDRLEQPSNNILLSALASRKPDEQYDDTPWLTIATIFSQCQLTYETDRLAAIAGLVNKKQNNLQNAQATSRNFCGLWERDLQLELAWISCKGKHLHYLHQLNLPSWSWISYKGPVSFMKDPRSSRETGRLLSLPNSEIDLIAANVPNLTTLLPLKQAASLTLKMTLRKMQSISTGITDYGTTKQSRKELAKASPFDFDPRTNTTPVPLSALTDCQELYNENKRLVGFVSFDDGTHPVGELFCAHLSTLKDEATSAAEEELAKPDIIDGLPLADVVADSRKTVYAQHPINSTHKQLCSGVEQKTREFREKFRLADVQFDSRVLFAYLAAAPGSRSFNTRLIELLAVSIHKFAVSIVKLDISLHKDDGITQWAPPTTDKFYWKWNPNGPPATMFVHPWYQDHDQYPDGIADMVGYWAESRIFGGVVLFDRHSPDGASESDAVYLHPNRRGVTYRICRLLPEQKQALLEFATASQPGRNPLPILPNEDNRERVDPEEPIEETEVYRDLWERKFHPEPFSDRRLRHVWDTLEFPTHQDRYDSQFRAVERRRLAQLEEDVRLGLTPGYITDEATDESEETTPP
ncbi:hypothetical protein HJFPF1_05707 [Paramyrothecium foliicola]|nr:hypothetical protein HJFPF1_05707 [Paramyrothecium foliicola]